MAQHHDNVDLRLARKPPEELTLDELARLLKARYTGEPVPPCRVCAGPLSIVASGGGNATRYACSGMEADPDNPGQLRRKPWRSLADEHHERSGWTQHQPDDGLVLELLKRLETRSASSAELEPAADQCSSEWNEVREEAAQLAQGRGLGDLLTAVEAYAARRVGIATAGDVWVRKA